MKKYLTVIALLVMIISTISLASAASSSTGKYTINYFSVDSNVYIISINPNDPTDFGSWQIKDSKSPNDKNVLYSGPITCSTALTFCSTGTFQPDTKYWLTVFTGSKKTDQASASYT